MYILKKGREPFLSFLRNLTPQVMFLALGLIQAVKFKMGICCYFSKESVVGTTLMFVCFGIFFLAALANGINFFNAIVADEFGGVRENEKKLRANGQKGVKFFIANIKFACTHYYGALFSLALGIVIVEIAGALVVVMAVPTAENFLKIFH